MGTICCKKIQKRQVVTCIELLFTIAINEQWQVFFVNYLQQILLVVGIIVWS